MTDDVAMDTGDVMDSDDADWYREEVGEEPDAGKSYVTIFCVEGSEVEKISKGSSSQN